MEVEDGVVGIGGVVVVGVEDVGVLLEPAPIPITAAANLPNAAVISEGDEGCVGLVSTFNPDSLFCASSIERLESYGMGITVSVFVAAAVVAVVVVVVVVDSTFSHNVVVG